MFWELSNEELLVKLREVEADRVARLAAIEEIWADRDTWIEKYTALDRQIIALMHERDNVINQRDHMSVERDTLLQARALLVAERDAYLDERRTLLEECDALIEDRAKVEHDRDRLAQEGESLRGAWNLAIARAEEAERKLEMLKRFSPWRFLPVSLKKVLARQLRRLRRTPQA